MSAMLRRHAVAYLTNLNSLEIIAGLNFRAAKDDLANRGMLSAELGQRLDLAFRQEMAHAVQVRRMLKVLGVQDKASLTRRMLWLNDMATESLSDFPAEQHPCLRIHLNHALEEKFAAGGNQATYNAMRQVVMAMPTPAEQAALHEAATDFYLAVAREEPEHAALDVDVLSVYARVFPALNIRSASRAIRRRSSPLRSIYRAKLTLTRATQKVYA